MPYYTRRHDKRRFFVRGTKPAELAEISKITQRHWQMYENHLNRENPILIGIRFLKVFEQESLISHAKAAEILGVSRIRVYQLTSLIAKLPAEITDYLLRNSGNPAVLRHFTERRLRPLTMLSSPKEQLTRFREMVHEINTRGHIDMSIL